MAENSPIDIDTLRQMMHQSEQSLVSALGPPPDNLEELYSEVPLPDGHKVKSKIWRPKSQNSSRPLIILFHGGGFAAGSCEMCTTPGRDFALELDAVVVSAEYRMAPEYRFPQAMLDAADVVEWLIRNAGSDPSLQADVNAGVIVGGYSAGASVSAVAARELMDRKLPAPVTGSFLCIPGLFDEKSVPAKYKDVWTSRDDNDSPAPMKLGKKEVEALLENFGADTLSPLFCPAHHASGLGGLPRTYVQTGKNDTLRDDGIVYSKLLKDAGVDTKMDCYDHLGHEAWTIWTNLEVPENQKLKDQTLDGMRWLLRK